MPVQVMTQALYAEAVRTFYEANKTNPDLKKRKRGPKDVFFTYPVPTYPVVEDTE